MNYKILVTSLIAVTFTRYVDGVDSFVLTKPVLADGTPHRQVNYLDNDVLYVTGEIVLLSNITRAELGGAKRLIYVIASKAISVDESISLVDTHIVLRAPVIEVVGSVLFKMEGINGSAQGEDGISSGSVIIAAETIRNGGNWTIQSQGGDGVQGDDGTNGTDGIEAILGYDIKNMTFCLRHHMLDNKPCNKAYPGRELKLIKYDWKNSITAEAYARDGTAPGNGSRGNDGSRGGKNGGVSVKFTFGTPPQVSQTDGSSGTGGIGGRPGTKVCTQIHFTFTCDVYMFRDKMDNCRYVGNDCLYMSNGVHGSPGATPNAELNYKYAGPDENSHYEAEAYLLRSLITHQTGITKSDLVNIPQA